MTDLSYADYVALFNSGDDAAFIAAAFTEDCVVTTQDSEVRGHAALADFLRPFHDGVRAIMRPQSVIERDDELMTEVDIDFHGMESRPDFPFQAIGPGDLVTVKFFARYRRRDGRFAEVKIAHWAPGYGVSVLPRLGPHESQMAAFRAYSAAFSAADTEGFGQFYTDDIVLELGAVPPLRGKAEIAEFYQAMYGSVLESVTIRNLLVNENAIAADMFVHFTAVADAPHFPLAALKTGDTIDIPEALIFYELRDGLMSRVTILNRGDVVTSG